jgi:hypothetical protein
MNQKHLDSSLSTARRKLLIGLTSASAVVAAAPNQWTQPVLKRMITSAHGQAVSIAAGRYTAQFSRVTATCTLVIEIVFDWPGGISSTELIATFTRLSSVGDCSGEDGSTETGSGIISIGPSGSGDLAQIELTNTSPSLPAGFSFYFADL